MTDKLTDDELVAAMLAARGLTIFEIGEEMGLSHRQAKYLVDTARKKLGVKHKRWIGQALKEAGYGS